MSRLMKDSGIAWIGEIPSNWFVDKVKFHLQTHEYKGYPDATVLSLYRELGVIPKDSRDDNHNVTSDDTSKYKHVEVGDFVVNKMKAWQGSVAVSNYEGIVSPAYYIYRFSSDAFYKGYFHYLLRDKSYTPEFRRLSGGIREGQWDLSREGFRNLPVIVPPIEEQQAIASYLDKKTKEIDTAITEAQELIEKYKAYKQSIITEIVTTGLNPNAQMQNSGIEWIPEIPAHWKTVPFRSYVIERSEKNKGEKTRELLALSFALGVTLYRDKVYNMDRVKEDYEDYQIVYKDDLVLSPNDIIKGSAFVSKYYGCISPMYLVFSARHASTHYLPYLSYLLRTKEAGWKFFFIARGLIGGISNTGKYVTRRMTVSRQDLMSFKVLLPPYDEQLSIVDYLDKKTTDIDKVIAQKENLITQLQEYKKSVIFEYVTGKKEVPNG